MLRIDSHHHFWNYDAQQYGWIDESMSVLRRDFGIEQLRGALAPSGIRGAVTVQARQSLEETEWLLELAEAHEELVGVVGWVPLTADETELRPLLERLSERPLLRGVRHVVQDEPDERFLLREDFGRGVGMLHSYGLTYDVLIYARHLPHAITFADRQQDQRLIVDHVAKPTIEPQQFDRQWAEQISALAQRPHVACKVSGMITEMRGPEGALSVPKIVQQLRPYWDVVLEAFGPQRLMFGSDWPVCLLRGEYGTWVAALEELAESLSAPERAQLWGGTAQRWYQLQLPG
jgi:L-fuconolactonase